MLVAHWSNPGVRSGKLSRFLTYRENCGIRVLDSVQPPRGEVSGHPGFGFGVLIAYVLPGFVVLWSLALVVPTLSVWLVGDVTGVPTIGGVLYSTAASIDLGLVLSVLRWATVDRVLSAYGIRRPVWDERLLQENLDAFRIIVENHYRYYEFFAHTALAILLASVPLRMSEFGRSAPAGLIELCCLALASLLLAGSADALRTYFLRTRILLGMEVSDMTNGNHPKPQPQSAAAAGTKSEAPVKKGVKSKK